MVPYFSQYWAQLSVRLSDFIRPSLRTHLPATAALTCCFGFVEKRQKFDNGEDPLDPEQQQQGGGGPFWHEGFNPFGGSGFKFKFNFN